MQFRNCHRTKPFDPLACRIAKPQTSLITGRFVFHFSSINRGVRGSQVHPKRSYFRSPIETWQCASELTIKNRRSWSCISLARAMLEIMIAFCRRHEWAAHHCCVAGKPFKALLKEIPWTWPVFFAFRILHTRLTTVESCISKSYSVISCPTSARPWTFCFVLGFQRWVCVVNSRAASTPQFSQTLPNSLEVVPCFFLSFFLFRQFQSRCWPQALYT